MNGDKDFFQKMCDNAIEEMASGKGWENAPPNVVILACFGMLTNHLSHKLTRPIWFLASSAAAGTITLIITSIFGN